MNPLKLACQEEYNYLILLDKILNEGAISKDRTGVGTKRIFGAQLRFDLAEGFPLLTTKKVFWKGVVGELLWFLSGSTNNNDLVEKYGVHIWDEWAKPDGDLGAIYSKQWRRWEGFDRNNFLNTDNLGDEELQGRGLFYQPTEIDQIANVIQMIKTNPDSRRMIVSAWNPAEIADASLPPCHTLFQFGVIDGKLNCHMFQRSADMFLGVPFNIASYALLTHMIAHVTGYKVGEFVHSITDAHIYSNHELQVREQLSRKPFPFPKLHLNFMKTDIDSFTPEDIAIVDYQHHDAISAPVAI